jgi:hypothetical protein
LRTEEDSVAIVNVNQVLPTEVIPPPNAKRGRGKESGRGRGASSGRGKSGRGGRGGTRSGLAEDGENKAADSAEPASGPITTGAGEQKNATAMPTAASGARAGLPPNRLVDKARSGRGLGAGRQRGRGKGL